MPTTTQWDRWWPRLRDLGTWSIGAGLLIYETVIRHGTDQALLVVIAGLIGLPVVVRYEEKRRPPGESEETKRE